MGFVVVFTAIFLIVVAKLCAVFTTIHGLIWLSGLLIKTVILPFLVFLFVTKKFVTKKYNWKTWFISISATAIFASVFGGSIYDSHPGFFSPTKEMAERQEQRQKEHHETLDNNNWATPSVVQGSRRQCPSGGKTSYLSTYGYKGYTGAVQGSGCVCTNNEDCQSDEACVGRERLAWQNGEVILVSSGGRYCVRRGEGFFVRVFSWENPDLKSQKGYLGDGVAEVTQDGIVKFSPKKFGF